MEDPARRGVRLCNNLAYFYLFSMQPSQNIPGGRQGLLSCCIIPYSDRLPLSHLLQLTDSFWNRRTCFALLICLGEADVATQTLEEAQAGYDEREQTSLLCWILQLV